jgi:hypothetical protein
LSPPTTSELNPSGAPTRAAPVAGGARKGITTAELLERLRGGHLYFALAGIALVIAAFSLLFRSTPSYDPWAWLVWGREIVHLDLHTTGGPSWKPLPVIFTTLFAPFGKAAPDLWLVIARTGALIAVAMAFKLAFRLTRMVRPHQTVDTVATASPTGFVARASDLAPPLIAGIVAAGSLVVSAGFISDNALGYSEGLMAALMLIAVDRHLDGQRRQAFAVAAAAALDRPEIWPFWGIYGLYLWWKDPGARKLVMALFAVTPLLWFLPELWGSGHLFRGVNRAQHPRSNSAAFASCPFCSELADHAWKLVLLRVKVVVAIGLAVAAVTLWRRRRRGADASPAGAGAGLRRQDGAVLAVGALGLAWIFLIAVMTQAGFSGNNRYLVLGTALIVVVGGVGWGWLAHWLGALLKRFTAPAAAGLAGALAVTVVFMALPPWIGGQVVDLPATHRALNYQAQLRYDLARAVRRGGGAKKLFACGNGRVMTEGFQVPMVAYALGVRTLRVEANPVKGPTPAPYPSVIMQARANRRAHLLPLLPPAAGFHRIVHTRTFQIYTSCR